MSVHACGMFNGVLWIDRDVEADSPAAAAKALAESQPLAKGHHLVKVRGLDGRLYQFGVDVDCLTRQCTVRSVASMSEPDAKSDV